MDWYGKSDLAPDPGPYLYVQNPVIQRGKQIIMKQSKKLPIILYYSGV